MNEDLSKSVKTVKNPFYIVNDALNDGDAVTVKLTCADSSKECKIHVIQESISGLQWQSYVTALSNGEITFNKKEIGKAISFASSNTIKVKGAPVCTFI
ncbi:hypothetical protein TVAG_138000 [Trichomonas vaginalis G3]|uniref:Uncharacterized protein n=1 Tax=Trichomonas vaginalis (strain ATCC PRA-98 / G3) TaxID=412133 RepID=A2EC31_TRIV3|nr:hypothetical protein TVAGG3_0269580 [Trichomonas vaginalis G3]EAY09806.1 hypothetical protein TVAG_138000 [Trichomonas vaginalis G3]KAI5525757.1 hypothetical protein TVAGG3_0269580 [Trichomonas vaginalis G3]|eukprot:XP_001322029.1 hypothetical protein [Trichomonas vaginalis G3]